jgi:hypothetical protein
LVYTRSAKYFGYDKYIDITASRDDMKSGRSIDWEFTQEHGTSCSGISVSAKRLPGSSSLGQDSFVLNIKLLGLGTAGEDGFKGDATLKILLDP